MKKILDFIKRERNIVVVLLSIVIFISPFVVNYSDLPKGFELPKVHFVNLAVAVISLVFLFKNSKNQKFDFKALILFLGIISLYIISTLLSINPNISLNGNSFRDQGLIFYTLITVAGFLAYFSINKKNIFLIFGSLFISSFSQSIVAINQFINYANKRPELLDDGVWINGTFGQANFFSTLLVLGFICGIYFLYRIKKLEKKFALKVYLSALTFLALVVILFALIASFSIFGWISFGIALAFIIPYFLMREKIYLRFFLASSILLIVVGSILISQFRDNLRVIIWEESWNVLVADGSLIRYLFGYGFDTLGTVFREAGKFSGALVDRGHNIFVDIVMQVGLVGLSIFLFLSFKVFGNLKKILSNKEDFFLFILFFVFIVKTFIHEYSAINLFVFMVIFGALVRRTLVRMD